MSRDEAYIKPGSHPNKIGICSKCGKRIRYGNLYKHDCYAYQKKKGEPSWGSVELLSGTLRIR